MGPANWQKALDFVRDVFGKFVIGENNVRVGLVTYGESATSAFHLNQHYTKSELENSVSQTRYQGTGTNTADALLLTRSDQFTDGNGDRADVDNIAILVTDGTSTNPPATIREGQQLKNNTIRLISVGVGEKVNTGELDQISDPGDVYLIEDYNELLDILQEIGSVIGCGKCYIFIMSQVWPFLEGSYNNYIHAK